MSRLSALASALFLAGSGCQLRPTFSTGYVAASANEATTGRSISVRTLADARPPVHNPSSGRLFLTYVPLLPWVDMSSERGDEIVADIDRRQAGHRAMSLVVPVVPDAGDPKDFAFPEAMARAIAEDLRRCGAFPRVETIGLDAPASTDLVLEGTLRSARYRDVVTSYCLGIAGVLLWLLPIPIGKTGGEVQGDLVLKDARTGKALWSGPLEGKTGRLYLLYTSSAMVYGAGGAFAHAVHPGPKDGSVDPRSMFTWQFAALREAMAAARPAIVAAARGAAAP